MTSNPCDDDDQSVFMVVKGVRRYFHPGEIIQPCSSVETMMAHCADYGAMNTVQAIWLQSKLPINPEEVQKSLWTVSREIPQLQFCLMKRESKYWFRRMPKFKMDFEICSKEVMDVFYELSNITYDLWTGPLWKVRLILSDFKKSNSNQNFSAVLIFALQHCITDATTNMMLCQKLVSFLNKIYSGETITPVYNPVLDINEEISKYKVSIIQKVKKLFTKFDSTMIRNFSHKSSFDGVLPMPKIRDSSTKILFDEFTTDETQCLLKLCKNEKITLHSLVVTIANFALLTVAQSRSATEIGSTTLNVTHSVNMRRYFGPHEFTASGCYVSYIEDKNKISLEDADNFWKVAMRIHSHLKNSLEVELDPLKLFPLLGLAWIMLPVNKYLTRMGWKNKTDCHYVTTNMGNLKSLMPAPCEDDFVQITNLLRSATIPYAGSPFVLAFQTFRNKLMISMDYCTNKMTDEVSMEFFNQLIQFIRHIIKFNCIT